MAKRELHMGKRLEDLDKHAVVTADVQKTKIHIVLTSARKLLDEADKYNRIGDEELAYISYMKYFQMLLMIQKKHDFPQNARLMREKLGNNTTSRKAMDQLELLKSSLHKRYERFNVMPKGNNAATPIDNTIYDKLTASEKFDCLMKGTTMATSHPSTPTQLPTQLEMGHPNNITCVELFERTKKHDVLIMDCRPRNDYELSHLTYTNSFNVPEELISNGMSAGKLQESLNESAKFLWASRSVKNHVVLMDWNCKNDTPPEGSAIGILWNILKYWDPDVTYRSPIRILEGGYEYFIMMYPTLCTNPSVQAPQKSVQISDLIDDIEYPSISDITMKVDVIESLSPHKPTELPQSRSSSVSPKPPNRPSVDRSSKLAAIKTYEEKQMPIKDIMKEHEDLLARVQKNDEQLQEASSKWKTIFKTKGEVVTPDTSSKLTNDEQELLYKILQLESTADDYKLENDRLREELDNYKRREQQEKLDAIDVESLKEATKKMETKIEERRVLDEQHERERHARELQLAMAREHKRHMKTPTEDEEEMSKAKIPQFDRSAKPQYSHTPTYTSTSSASSSPQTDTSEYYRDFSPVPGAVEPGLTGLKNLGNTCYMNSILQCLSNTTQLTQYCITNKYKRYISRTNKTKGQIVEEVAALIKILWEGNYKCVASKDLRYVIGQYEHIFSDYEQQDSHEFLTILMDWLHSDLQTLRVPEKPRSKLTPSEKAWLEFTKGKESLILNLFYGQIKSTVKCAECLRESATYESFSNLSLELPSNSNVCYLTQCLDMYFSGEVIHGWNCPNCKQKRNAIKKLDISKLPPVLVIHLKRFYVDPDSNGDSFRKKHNYVRFPLEGMDMRPYIAKSESRSVNPKTYDLYGISNHYGSMEGGHYTAFCRSGNYNRWYKFDDQVVSSIDYSNVVSSAAYILFYTWQPSIKSNSS